MGGLIGWITLEILGRHLGLRGERIPVIMVAFGPFCLGFGLWSIAGGPFLNRKRPDPTTLAMVMVAALGGCFIYAYLMKTFFGI